MTQETAAEGVKTAVASATLKTNVSPTTADEFFVIRFAPDSESIRYTYFNEGVNQNEDWGARDKQYKPTAKPPEAKRWYREVSAETKGEASGEAKSEAGGEEKTRPFEAFADNQELAFTREFKNANEKISWVNFSMRFSTGRFSEEWKEDGAAKYTVNGQCINLKRAAK